MKVRRRMAELVFRKTPLADGLFGIQHTFNALKDE